MLEKKIFINSRGVVKGLHGLEHKHTNLLKVNFGKIEQKLHLLIRSRYRVSCGRAFVSKCEYEFPLPLQNVEVVQTRSILWE